MAEADRPQGAPIVMPKLGLTMSEGLIAEWHVKPGDQVAGGQTLFVVETDKISNEIAAPAPGRIISILAAEGDTVPVGVTVALWTGPSQGGDVPMKAAEDAETPSSPEGRMPAMATSGEPRLRATPFARRLAMLGGIALSDVTGSGPRGRIQARDVQAALHDSAPPSLEPAAPAPAAASIETPVIARREQRDLRPLIATRVSRAKAEIPHFHVTADAEFDALTTLRSALNSDPQAPLKLSVTALLGMAVARSLADQPGANAVWKDGHVMPLDGVAIGIAVDTPGGVIAPVVPVTGGLYAFAAMLHDAVERARSGRLIAQDAGAAAIGISNVGMFGVRALAPIIDPDQSFMLGVGAPHVSLQMAADGAIKTVQQVTLTLACDHRLIDGAAGARLLATMVEAIERPLRLVASWA